MKRSDMMRECPTEANGEDGPEKGLDALDQRGAMALAKRLERYWHARGYPAARFWAEPVDERFPKVGTYEIYRVVSNLVDGLPPRYQDEATTARGPHPGMPCRAPTAHDART
jgi:hypothetical protein